MKLQKILFVLLIAALPIWWPSSPYAQGAVEVGHERIVLPSYVEPNTPGAPGVTADPALVAAVTDPAAFDADGLLSLNKAVYVRFFDQNRAADPEVILVMIPGVVAGANSYRIVANELVRLSDGRIEVWAIDRRSNLLEDLEPMIMAENAGTAEASMDAIDAYVSNPAGAGGYVNANPLSPAIRFIGEWGVDVTLRDARTVVERARTKTSNVFVGGHSLGAVLTQLFAGYNFGDMSGYQLVKGIILLDGTGDVLGVSARPIADSVYLNGGTGPTGAVVGLNQLRNPTSPDHAPFVTSPFNPFLFQLVEIGAQLVIVDPDGPSVLRQVVPELVPVSATNAAALGMNLDDEFQREIFARFSIGFLDVPSGRPASDVATSMRDPAGANPNGLWTPRDLGGNMQKWGFLKNLDPISGLRGPEPSDFETVVRAFLLGDGNQTASTGDTNFVEWYFPSRLVADVSKVINLDSSSLSQAVIDAQRARGGNAMTVTETRQVNVPILGVRASEGGFVTSNLGFTAYVSRTSTPSSKLTVATMQNFAHDDMLTSLEGRSQGRDAATTNKNVPELIYGFLQANQTQN